MSSILECHDLRDVVLLNEAQGLYLKPLACVCITVQLPTELKKAGKSVSTWEIMDKIKSAASPDEIIGIKVLKSTLEVVRFEAHLENRYQIRTVLDRLDRTSLKLNNFAEPFKLRACELKLVYPTRYEWDSFFHDCKNMNELKPGERADTVHFKMLPCQWFMPSPSTGKEVNKKLRPSESVVRSVFEVFGSLRSVDIPMLDPYRSKIDSTLNTFAFGQDGLFEAYVQFQDYIGFAKCMTAFRGMKLLFRQSDKAWTAVIQVDFDRSRHQSESSIRYRKLARERIIQEELNQERAEKARRELETVQQEQSRRQHEIADEIVKMKKEEETNMKKKKLDEGQVALEERKLILVQRRVESLRLLDAILDRVKTEIEMKAIKLPKAPKKKEKSKKTKEEKKQLKLKEKEKALRAKLLKKYQQVGEKMLEEQRERVRQTVQSSTVKLKSTVNVVPSQPIFSGSNHQLIPTSQPSTQEFNGSSRVATEGQCNLLQSRPPYDLNHSKPYQERPSSGFNSRGSDRSDHPYGGKRYEPESFYHRRAAYGDKRDRFHSDHSLKDQLENELWNGPDLNSSRRGQRENWRGRGHYQYHGPYTARNQFQRSRPHNNLL